VTLERVTDFQLPQAFSRLLPILLNEAAYQLMQTLTTDAKYSSMSIGDHKSGELIKTAKVLAHNGCEGKEITYGYTEGEETYPVSEIEDAHSWDALRFTSVTEEPYVPRNPCAETRPFSHDDISHYGEGCKGGTCKVCHNSSCTSAGSIGSGVCSATNECPSSLRDTFFQVYFYVVPDKFPSPKNNDGSYFQYDFSHNVIKNFETDDGNDLFYSTHTFFYQFRG